jgi:molecular chaperone GrpE
MSETGAGRARDDLPPGNVQPESAGEGGAPGAPVAPGAPAARPAGDEAAARTAGQPAQAGAAGDGAGAELADLRSRVADAEDLRLRALADLDNLRKRCAAQVSRAVADTQAAVASEWLPVVDNLDRALAHSEADPDAIIQGVRAVRDQAQSILARLGFPRRADVGARFDPASHEAVAVQADTDAEAGTVIEVVRPGYGDREHQLRPAQVVVAKAD